MEDSMLKKLDANPTIPVGLATKLGTIVAAIAAVCAAILPLLEGDQTPEVIAVILAGGAAIYKVLDGRYSQAAAREGAKAVTNVANAISEDATGQDKESEISIYDIDASVGEGDDDNPDLDKPVAAPRKHNGPGTDLHDAEGA